MRGGGKKLVNMCGEKPASAHWEEIVSMCA